jgi:hypothetical protein
VEKETKKEGKIFKCPVKGCGYKQKADVDQDFSDETKPNKLDS